MLPQAIKNWMAEGPGMRPPDWHN